MTIIYLATVAGAAGLGLGVLLRVLRWLAPFDLDTPSKYGRLDTRQMNDLRRRHP